MSSFDPKSEPVPDERYIFLSEELEQALKERGLPLTDLLKQAGIHDFQVVPESTAPVGTREAVTVILASAALVAACTPVLLRLIEALTHRDAIVVDREVSPAKDEKGNLVPGHVVLREHFQQGQSAPSTSTAHQKLKLSLPGIKLAVLFGLKQQH
jgi:hypothetical protein